MNVLQQITGEQRDLIVALPYRAGFWISQSDQEGGDTSEMQELQALHNIIQGFSSQVFGSELVQHIMSETVTRKAEWKHWHANIDQVPFECQKALDVLRQHCDPKDVSTYVSRLMDIAEAVALAFREADDNLSFIDMMKRRLEFWRDKRNAQKHNVPAKSFDQFLQISPDERQALSQMARALGTNY